MRTILSHDESQSITYTGNPTDWPNGLYKCQTGELIEWVCVYEKTAATWASLGGAIRPVSSDAVFLGQYKKMPGYTGKIESVMPEYIL